MNTLPLNARAAPPNAPSAVLDRIYARITWKIIPLLFVCYIFAIIDRSNIAFAQLRMKEDLGFTDAMYGFGASVFFIAYFLFEVPSNLLLKRIGARKTIARIMILWGLVSAGMMLVDTPTSFYVLRFLLGAFEAGFFPGVIYFLTLWYPAERRGRIIGLFMAASAVAPALGSLASSWLMSGLDGWHGHQGWRWMFFFEGIPATLLGLYVLMRLPDHAGEVRWLSADEKALLQADLQKDAPAGGPQPSFLAALKDWRIYLLSFAYFTSICATFVLQFWLPTILRDLGIRDLLSIGLYSAIPFCIGGIAMVLVGRHSDRTQERRWHFAVCAFIGAACLACVPAASSQFFLAFAILTVAAAAIYPTMPVFWTLPSSYLSREAAAGGIALINSLGLLGGIVSPNLVGWFRTNGAPNAGFYVIAALFALGALALLAVTARSRGTVSTGTVQPHGDHQPARG